MPNELIPFNEAELLIYPIVGYERRLPIVECQRDRGSWYFNCPFCGAAHSHYVGQPNRSFTAEISQRPRQRVQGECKRPGSPFHLKEYYIREEGDEKNGKWDKYLNLLDSHRRQRYARKKECSMLALFGDYCLIFDDPNAVTSNSN
jgi:hypothetical protein